MDGDRRGERRDAAAERAGDAGRPRLRARHASALPCARRPQQHRPVVRAHAERRRATHYAVGIDDLCPAHGHHDDDDLGVDHAAANAARDDDDVVAHAGTSDKRTDAATAWRHCCTNANGDCGPITCSDSCHLFGAELWRLHARRELPLVCQIALFSRFDLL